MQIGCTVLILPNAEYSGKFTGMTGKVGKYYGSAKNGPKVGVEFPGMKNDCESGLFWFSVEKVEVLQTQTFVEYLMNDAAFTAAPKPLYCGRMAQRPLFLAGRVTPTIIIAASVRRL